jgi:ferric-dicitrate binding protein FerR (iron transport regulator)
MNLVEAKQFVVHFVTGDYTPEEYATFLQWPREASVDEMNVIADEHEALHESWPLLVDGPSAVWVAELEEKLDAVSRELPEEVVPVRRVGLLSGRRVWVAAASVIVVLSAGGLWYTRQHAGQHEKSNISSQDRGAVLLSQVMSTPRGRVQQELTLPDGSKVWLNSASTLKYPVAFSGPERVVELSGEGFFEVAKNSAKPFRVRIKDAEVEVLGTHFNIMAYENDRFSRTTLIDGSVKLSGRSEQKELRPGQQAVMAYPTPGVAGGIETVTIKDPNEVIAWKDGILQFNSADPVTVMHTVERYYDVDIQFDQSMSGEPFTGGFPREFKLEKVLKVITSFYKLQFKMDGKSVTVTH